MNPFVENVNIPGIITKQRKLSMQVSNQYDSREESALS
jgi:hypothetical protein